MKLRPALLLSSAILAVPAALSAVPKSPTVVSGAVGFSQSGNRLTVTETSPSAVINWRDFSLAKGEIVQFVQPSASASILNRVTGGAASVIDGQVQANGQLFLLNPNGITIGASGRVSAAGLLLTSSAIADADYLAGRYVFTGLPGQGNVVNHGAIEAAEGGWVVLSAPQVTNDGSISAPLGRVALGGGAGFTLDPAGDGLWKYQITEPAAAALVANAGSIAADGGSVLISARSLDRTMRDVINTSGMIEARGVRQQNGEIILDGGDQGQVTLGAGSTLEAGGRITVNGAVTHVDGSLSAGFVETSGESLSLAGTAKVTSATWLLDPTDFVVDGSNNAAIQTGLATANVTIKTAAGSNTVTGATASNGAGAGANGDIVVAAALTWASNQTLTLDSYHSVLIQSAVTGSGNTAGIVIKTNDGGAGGALYTGSGGSVTLSGTGPSVTINGTGYTFINSAAGLQAMDTSTNYAIVQDINLNTIPSFQPIGFNAAGNNGAPTSFTGTLEGFGHSISHFVINDATNNNLGLISALDGTVRDLTIAAGSVTAGANVSAIGMLAGTVSGTIVNTTVGGTVSAGNTTQYVGGMVGWINGGTVSVSSFNGGVTAGTAAANIGGVAGQSDSGFIYNSYSKGSVSGGSGSSNIGGLLGNNPTGIVTASFSAANVTGGSAASKIGGLIGYNGNAVSYNYATGNVVGGSGAHEIGGLIGQTTNGFTLSYATGSVSGGANAANIGGLLGTNNAINVMTSVYATGAVAGGAGATAIGGLVGYNNTGNVGQTGGPGTWANTLYWDTTSTSQGSAFGTQAAGWTATTNPVALTDAQSKLIASYTNFSTTLWFSGTGGYPALVKSPYVLTVTPANKTVTYGTAPSYTATVTKFWPGDAVNQVSGLTFANSGGATPGVGSYTITASGASATGLDGTPYQFYYPTGTLTVNTAPLTITANDAAKAYGQTASFAGNAFSSSGLVYSDSVTSVTETSPGSAAGAATGSYAITPSAAVGSGLANYTITYSTGTLTVNAAALTIIANDAAKTYGTSAGFAGNAFTANGLISGDSVTAVSESSAGAGAGAATGSYPITPSAATGVGLGKYTITYTAGTLTVSPAPLTITANNAGKTYGQTASFAANAFTASGLTNGDSVTGISSASAGTAATAAAGSYAITPSAATGSGLANYTITYANGSLTVTPASLTISANNAAKTYGQTASFTGNAFTTSGLVNGDSVTAVNEASAGTVATAAAGAYPITPSAATGSGLANYTITYANGSLTVTPANLTISANNAAKTYGQTASFTGNAFTTSGLVNGDSVTAVNEASAGTVATAAAGAYPITPSAATGSGLANYTITYGNGTLTVNPAPLTITANNAATAFGQATSFAGNAFTASGLLNSDSVTSVTETSAGAAATAAGGFAIIPSAAAGSGLANYTITYLPGTLSVAAPPTKTVAAVITILTQPSGVSQPPTAPQTTTVTQTTPLTPSTEVAPTTTSAVTATPVLPLAATQTLPALETTLASTFIPTSQVDTVINNVSLESPATGTKSVMTLSPEPRGLGNLTLATLINGLVLQLMPADNDAADASPARGHLFPRSVVKGDAGLPLGRRR